MNTLFSKPVIRIVLALLLALLVWGIFAVSIHTILQENTLGADFATFWIGSQTALLQGKTPYSQEVTLQSQKTIYHRPAKPDEDQLAFAYPFPGVFLIIPVVWMSLDWAQAFWMSLNILVLLSILFFIFPKSPGIIRFGLMLFYPVFFGIILGNFAILVGAFILVFLQEIFFKSNPAKQKQIWIGMLISLCIIKPQFTWLYLLLAVIVALKSRLWAFLGSFFVSSLLLVITSLLILPSWPMEWFNRVSEYTAYVKGQPILLTYLQAFLPEAFVYPLAGLILFVLCLLSLWLGLKWWRNQFSPLLITAMAGGLTYLVHPHGISYEQITFLLPLLLWAVHAYKYQKRSTLIIWLISILLSWILFFLSFFKVILPAVNEYPFIFYLVWLLWLFWEKWANRNSKTDIAQVFWISPS